MLPVVEKTNPQDPEASALLRASHNLMRSLFSPEENHFLSIEALAAPDISFVTAKVEDRISGCGALAYRDGYGELKSMFTAPDARGKGVASAILNHLEEEARGAGLSVICLETGDLLHDAHRLYARHGFSLCDPFGDYVESHSSIFMEKRL